MYNRIILEKIIEEVGTEKTVEFCKLVSLMYDIKYNASKELNALNEFDYEREWWTDAAKELNNDITITD
jgi:hypothetical protein